MNCTIPASNLKVLNRAAVALAKLSDEVHFECHEEGIILSASNPPKTAYAKFEFDINLFSCYEYKSTNNERSISCKIYSRSLQTVFRRKLDKCVETCKIILEENADEIAFRLKFKSDAILIHKFYLIDWEGLTGNYFVPDQCSKIVAKGHLVLKLLKNFHVSDIQLFLYIHSESLSFRNYGSEYKAIRGLHVQVNVQQSEFLKFSIMENTNLLFPTKPLKSAVTFADNCSAELNINFTTGGEPLYLSVSHSLYNVLYVISTMETGNTDSQLSNNQGSTGSIISKVDTNALDNMAIDDIDWDSDLVAVTESMACSETSEQSNPKVKRLKTSKNDDTLPEVNPKILHVFGNCFDPTQQTLNLGEVLVSNSDSDDEF